MYKNVRAVRAPDESVALRVIEPLYGAFQTFHVKAPLSARLSRGGQRRARIGCILERLGRECQDEMAAGETGCGCGRASAPPSARLGSFRFARGKLARRRPDGSV